MVEYLRSSFLNPDIAIDIGTASVRVAYGGKGLHVVPSLFEGRRALQSGTVVDPEAVKAILRPLLKKVRRFGVLPPRAVACVPSDATSEELEAVRECVLDSGASNVYIVPEPLAAAVGAGLDVASPFANMILDIGEGVTDCAVIRSGKVVDMHASRIGCAELRSAIRMAASRRQRQPINPEHAERLLRLVDVGHGSMPQKMPERISPAGHNQDDGEEWYRDALDPLVEKILGVAQSLWSRIRPSLGCEIIENGIWLSGGGSLLKGMAVRLEETTRIRVNSVDHPLDAVVRGAQVMLPVIAILNGWEK